MAVTPPAQAPTGSQVSGTRKAISLVILAISLVVCAIELRAGLGQYLTMRSFNKKSENSFFRNVPFDEVRGMLAGFPSESEAEIGTYEDVHHYYWFSLLRPMTNGKTPELYVSSDHSNPAMAISYYTSIEEEPVHSQDHPNASAPNVSLGEPNDTGGVSVPPSDNSDRPPVEEASVPAASEPSSTEPAKPEGEPTAAPTAPEVAAPSDQPTAPESDAASDSATENLESDTPPNPG